MFACLCAVIAFSAASFAASTDASRRKIMEDVYKQDTSHDITMKANFQVFDNKGTVQKRILCFAASARPATARRWLSSHRQRRSRACLLSINQQGTTDRQFVYTPATQRVRSVVQQERSTRFIGTDFTFEDIGERVLDDFNYSLISDAETIDGHKCSKVKPCP